MADGEITVKLDADTERRLRAAASAAGRPVDDYLRDLIADDLSFDWAESESIAAETNRAGAWRTAEEAVAHFRSALQVTADAVRITRVRHVRERR